MFSSLQDSILGLEGGSWSRILFLFYKNPAYRHFYIAFPNPFSFFKEKTIVSGKTNYKFNRAKNKSRFVYILVILSCCQTALCIIAM